MFIVWSRGFGKELGETLLETNCGHFHNDVRMQARQIGRKFTLFWIPLFTTSSAYYVLCPICQHGQELSKELFDSYLLSSTEESA